MVETAKSTKIFTSALTWFLWRTVPVSRNAKPPCIANTRIAPISRKKTSGPCCIWPPQAAPCLRNFVAEGPSEQKTARMAVGQPSSGPGV